MSFKEFLAEKEKEKLKNAEDRKQEVIAAREESKSSEQAWKEVQNELFMITHGEKFNRAVFKWVPENQLPAMLQLQSLAVVFSEIERGGGYGVIFGPIPGNETLWGESKPPVPEKLSFRYLDGGRWSCISPNVTSRVMNSQETANYIAERFTEYFINYESSCGRS
jgi:hypothetical protein